MKITRLKRVCISIVFVLAPLPASAAKSLSLYLDGAVVTQQEIARKGYVEFLIPGGASVDSLRITPGSGVILDRVSTIPRKPLKTIASELASISDREELLQDRLKALSVREEIYKSAAKAQSAKAPRRTRTNPEPLSTIRQGTDYAIAQLEAVYQAKRKVGKELAQLGERRTKLQKSADSGGFTAKVWITPQTGKVTATWIQSDRIWTPSYQLRLAESGEAVMTLFAEGVTRDKGEAVSLHFSTVQSADASGIVYDTEETLLQKIPVKLVSLHGGAPQKALSMSLVNISGVNLPAGETACYHGGVYMGKGMFPGAAAGKASELICNGR